ncbi:MAG: hypothetical protein U0133_01440 [Gemmatimonadales bacterium]
MRVPSLKEFRRAKEKIGVDLLSDFKREARPALQDAPRGGAFSNRAYILIDKQGVVR